MQERRIIKKEPVNLTHGNQLKNCYKPGFMIYSIEIKEEARQDILQAALWYSDKAIDLHLKFIDQVEIILQSI